MTINQLLLEAIARRKCVAAIYNRTNLLLAPHILYTRHGDLFVDAITVMRNGEAPREIKLGTFKLAGLKEAALVERSFVPEAQLDQDDPRYRSDMVFAVEAN